MGACCVSEEISPPVKPTGGIEKKSSDAIVTIGAPKTEVKVDPTAGRKKQYAKNTPIQLGYWKMRGLAQPIRYLLEYTEHPYEDVMYEQGDAPGYSVECWTSVKNTLGLDFPSIPYVIDSEVKVTDVFAIMLYLATKYAPELIGSTPEEKGFIDQLYGALKDIKSAVTGPCYQGTDR